MISTFLGNKILDAIFHNSPLSIAAISMSAHTATPGRTGASEVVGGSYGRQTVTWDLAASRATDNDIAVLFSAMPACTATHVGFWDNASPPNFLLGASLATPRVLLAGDNLNFNIGELDPSIDWGD